MAFALPDLPYPPDALEPHIDAQTMKIHHGKHHNAYVTKLNDAIKGMPDLEAKPIEALIADLNSIPEKIRMAVRNNGGGHFNHSLFWTVMGPKAGG
ncbi:MAG: superoxide dismutase, partial [Planctomycetota bacterium]